MNAKPINTDNKISWFRNALSYIKFHENKIFVILLTSIDQVNAKQVLHDIAYLRTFNIKIVLVCGARQKIDDCLSAKGASSQIVNNLRITDRETLECVKEVNALNKLEIEAILSENAHKKIISGNFVTAKPVGVIDGIDFINTGKIRQIDKKAIKKQLKSDNLVLLTPLGFASTGEVFNLSAEDLASMVAAELKADKYIILHSGSNLTDDHGNTVYDLTTEQAEHLETDPIWKRYLDSAVFVCKNHVSRVHILNTSNPDTLLQELFSSKGGGTMVTSKSYEQIRKATLSDAELIFEIINSLAKDGMLLERDLATVEQNIDHYYLLERDKTTIGIVAIVDYEGMTELASLAVVKSYQNGGRGKRLLKYVEKLVKQRPHQTLFALTTQSSHWFIDNGFINSDLDLLPKNRVYDLKRNSKMYLKKLAK